MYCITTCADDKSAILGAVLMVLKCFEHLKCDNERLGKIMPDPCGLVQDASNAKMLLLLSGVGGLDEYDLIEAPDFRSEEKECPCMCMAFFRFFRLLCILAASIVGGFTLKILWIWIFEKFNQFLDWYMAHMI